MPQGAPELISTPEALDEFLSHIRQVGSFAFDTEFIGEETFIPLICLVQLATATRIALVDPLALSPKQIEPVWDAVCDEGLLTIVHAGGQDIDAAQRRAGRAASNVIDTQVSAGLLGMPWPSSLANVVHGVAKIKLAKGHTFTEWDSRPLSPSQLDYAADDVRYLPLVWSLQSQRLDQLSRREWAAAESELTLRTSEEFNPESQVRRAARGLGLRPRTMTILRELVVLRYRIAQAKNLPPRTVIGDGPILELSRRKFDTPSELHDIRGLSHGIVNEFGADILRTMSSARSLPVDRDRIWCAPEESAQDRTRIDALWSIITMRSISMGISTALVLTRAELSRWYLSAEAERAPLFPAGSWRQEAIGNWLDEFIAGRETLCLGWRDGGPVVP